MKIVLTPGAATLSLLERIYRGDECFQLDRAARSRMDRAAGIVSAAKDAETPVYGINTGFGKLASVRIEKADIDQLQRNLILSHCAGTGNPLSPAVTRLVIALKLLSLGRGASGVRWEIIEHIEATVAAGIFPVIPSQGSVGASGDLAPLAHMTATFIGEGKVVRKGQVESASGALADIGMKPYQLSAKEGLAMINGTQVSTALALAGLFDGWRVVLASLTTSALSVDAAMAATAPFCDELHRLRGHPGQIETARVLRELLEGSEIRESHREDDERVQDPYCLRCNPQVTGACIDLLRQAGTTLRTEANAVTDNPLVLSGGDIVSGGNFHAEPVAFSADQMALAISEVGCIAQRRIALLVDPKLNFGLPAFLAPRPGLNSGLMIAEVTSAALMSENRALANPRSVDSTPTSADQEDHVSMACHAAQRLAVMNRNCAGIVAIEAIAAAQGIEYRAPLATSPVLQHVVSLVREQCPTLQDDRILSDDIATMTALVHDSDFLSNLLAVTPIPLEFA